LNNGNNKEISQKFFKQTESADLIIVFKRKLNNKSSGRKKNRRLTIRDLIISDF